MRKLVNKALVVAGVCSAGLAFGQQNSYNDRYDRDYRDYRPSRRDERSFDRDIEERRDYNRRNDDNRRYDNRYMDRMGNNRNYGRMFDERDLSKAYDEGYEDGRQSIAVEERREHRENYKNFTFGLYGGANSTRFEGEDVQGNSLSGRLGYQLGFFVRGGGRVFGQIGAEYLTSSSDFYQAGDGSTVSDITSNVDQKYIHVPAYIGVKLAQSDRGISGVRLQIGAEYAAPLGVNNNAFNFSQSDFAAATINGLANIGFDAGPLFLDFVYHYGFADVLNNVSNTKRRILGVNLGVKF
ncbi:hypothetical protein GCM10028806_22250 [Spirosoma terrae]|uniref:PorT family protein n=1 Tax=Spirosoma terrae TaxID=1968276 RepID=A0A6L9L5R9_9BACT|nr:hypothetical protein [Spirosoma terrae]NDU94461.1 hypothetical protein [Spirosoma terrae]